jgi:hypothetical protein
MGSSVVIGCRRRRGLCRRGVEHARKEERKTMTSSSVKNEMVSWFGLPVGWLGGPDRWATARWWFSLFFPFQILFYFLNSFFVDLNFNSNFKSVSAGFN